VRSSFIAANATVSQIRLNANALEDQQSTLYSHFYRQQVVYSNRDECFQRISRVTGGAMIADNNLVRALSQAADKEYICKVIKYRRHKETVGLSIDSAKAKGIFCSF
jgi:hypothetical protein